MPSVVTCPSCGTKARVREAAPGLPRCPRCKAYLPWLVETGESGFELEAAAPVPVLVDLWAEAPRASRSRRYSSVSPSGRRGRIKVVKVNVDESPTLAARFGASSIPLLVVLRGGEVAERILGAQPLPALEARLSLHLA